MPQAYSSPPDKFPRPHPSMASVVEKLHVNMWGAIDPRKRNICRHVSLEYSIPKCVQTCHQAQAWHQYHHQRYRMFPKPETKKQVHILMRDFCICFGSTVVSFFCTAQSDLMLFWTKRRSKSTKSPYAGVQHVWVCCQRVLPAVKELYQLQLEDFGLRVLRKFWGQPKPEFSVEWLA